MKTDTPKFTPGPWKVVPFTEPDLCIPDVVSESRISVCTCYNGSVGDVNETNANARLIAAAPDLYAACEMIIRFENHVGAQMSAAGADAVLRAISCALAALAKAAPANGGAK